MEFKKLSIGGLILATPKVYKDNRGYFFESFNQKKFNNYLGKEVNFVQDNQSKSNRDTLRGLHFQKAPSAQGKLVRVLEGEIFDVVVDLRLHSNTFGQSLSVILSSESFKTFYIPEGFAHGFQVTSNTATVFYKTTDFYNADSEITLAWNDPEIKVNWPNSKKPNLSKKDCSGLFLDILKKEIQGKTHD